MRDLVQQARAFSMDKRFLPAAYDLVPAMADEIERLRAALVDITSMKDEPLSVAGMKAILIADRALAEAQP